MSKIEYRYPLNNLVSKVYKIYHIFGESSNVSSEESTPLVLLLLSMFKDGLINAESINNHDSFEKFQETIDGLSHGHDKNQQYQAIVQIMRLSLAKINNHAYNRICYTLSELDDKFLKENFSKVFDDVLYRVSQSQGRYAGEFIQPIEITRLICALTDLPEKAKVFNPFAGLASFGLYLNQGLDYYGQEKNQKTWALGALRIMAYGRKENLSYECEDSILNWPEASEKFDLIVANPPYGMRLGHEFKDIAPEFRTVEQFLLEKGVESLNSNGKLIALLPNSILSSGIFYSQYLRKNLVDHDIIETIISLPNGLLFNVGISLTIIVINKNKSMPGMVRFIDAKKYIETKNIREKKLKDNELIKVILGSNVDSDVVRIIGINKIQDQNYNLSVGRYFKKQVEGVKLGDILEFVRGERKNLPKNGKLLRIRDLKNDKVNFDLDVATIEVYDLRRPGIHLINESCLLLAMRWRTLKPTFFEFKGEPIFSGQDILSFKFNVSIVDKAYLINELHSDYVQEQLESYGMGDSSMSLIRKEDLMEVVIKLPSLEVQRAKVQGIYEISHEIKAFAAENTAVAYGNSIKQFNEYASLKHTLGRPRQNILDWSDNLLDFLNKKQESFESLNKEFAKFYDIDIISVLKEIKRDVNFITDVLEKGENGLVLSEHEKHLISLSDINSIIHELSNNGLKFKIKKLALKGEKLKERGISANKTLFKTLLDNILTNANKYAFDKKSSGNEVVIELTEVDDFLSLEIKNNGKPFPKNFDREKFISKYSTADTSAGSGLGGYDIHRIATDFDNPDWILSLNEDPLYPVIFKFQFPIKLIS